MPQLTVFFIYPVTLTTVSFLTLHTTISQHVALMTGLPCSSNVVKKAYSSLNRQNSNKTLVATGDNILLEFELPFRRCDS